MVINLKNQSERGLIYKKVIGFDPIKCECKTVIISNLQHSKKTLLELQRLAGGVDYELISKKLQDLEDINLITKKVNYGYPARIEYALTTKGWECARTLRNIVDTESLAG